MKIGNIPQIGLLNNFLSHCIVYVKQLYKIQKLKNATLSQLYNFYQNRVQNTKIEKRHFIVNNTYNITFIKIVNIKFRVVEICLFYWSSSAFHASRKKKPIYTYNLITKWKKPIFSKSYFKKHFTKCIFKHQFTKCKQ